MDELKEVVLEEIALEGLEGCTLRNLWLRLAESREFALIAESKHYSRLSANICTKVFTYASVFFCSTAAVVEEDIKDYIYECIIRRSLEDGTLEAYIRSEDAMKTYSTLPKDSKVRILNSLF